MKKNIVLCGVGGQGTVLAAKLLAALGMEAGNVVTSAETIGMAQRGGSVFSFVRIGDEIDTPMLGKGMADLIIAFEPAEAVRMLPYLKKGGTVIANTRPVIPVTASLRPESYNPAEILAYLKNNVENCRLVDAADCADALGNGKVLNIVLLGAAAACGALGFAPEAVETMIEKTVPAKFLELNKKAFAAGQKL